MARQRLLDPGFFTDATLLTLSPLTRILFAGLWCVADREGRLVDNALDLKIRLLPADACDVEAMLADLERTGRIVRYRVGDRRLLRIVHFCRYQHPHHREKASGLPDESQASPGPASGQPEESPGPAQGEPPASPEKARASPSVAVAVAVADTVAVAVKQPREGAVGVAPTEPPLRDQLEADFAAARGRPYAWARRDDDAVGTLLGLPGASWEEIRRRWGIALRTSFPRCRGVADLLREWNSYATDEPTRPKSAGAPVRAEAVNWSGVSSEVSNEF